MAVPNISEMLASTIEARGSEFRDNVTDNNAVLMRLSEKGNIRTFDGGHTIREELDFGENGNATWYSGYDTISVGATDVLSAAEFDMKQLAVTVTISGREKLQNSGKAKMLDLMEARVKNAERTMKNKISYGLHSDGTAFGGNIITGLAALAPTDPTTGTYGGINRATAAWAFWRSQLRDNTSAASTIQADMTLLYVACSRGSDHPDLILSGNDAYTDFLASLQAIQRIENPKLAQAGFTSVKFIGADVVLDGGIGGNMDTDDMVFLNTDFVHYRPHVDCNMVPLKPEKRSAVNQDAEVVLIGWAGNLTCSGPQFCGRYWAD